MQKQQTLTLAGLLKKQEAKILEAWLKYQLSEIKIRSEFYSESVLRPPCKEFLGLLQDALQKSPSDKESREWDELRSWLSRFTSKRFQQGFTPSETIEFVFSLKRPFCDEIRATFSEIDELSEAAWFANSILDSLALYAVEVYNRNREEVIKRQQKDLLELSTPVTKLWDGILSLPLIGTLDSTRTQTIMETLLEKIVENSARIAIIDITGVPAVDTQTAQHLIKTVTAVRLMGAECIISGVRPQIAQTIVHLGIDLSDVTTKATKADAMREAFRRLGYQVNKLEAASLH